MKRVLIAAMDRERGIGRDNTLMWHLPADMKFFKETTRGHVVVMGRKNFESIPERFRPLPDRENAILTRNPEFEAPHCRVFHSLTQCLDYYRNDDRTIFIIGGGEIYRQSLEADVVEEMYITHVNHTFGADTFFPVFDLKQWNVQTIDTHQKDEKHMASFAILHYTRKA